MGREGASGSWKPIPGDDDGAEAPDTADDSIIAPQKADAAHKKLLDYDEVHEELEEEDDDVPLCENFLHYVLPNLCRRWKSILAAAILLLLGVVFFGVSIFSFTQGWWGYGASLIVLALICGLPGAFVFFVVYKVIRMDPDYDLDIVPDYNMTV